MLRRFIFAPLAFLIVVSSATWERDAEAGIFEIWLQAHGGGLAGVGSDAFEGVGMPFFGAAAGVELFWVDIFVDLRLEDVSQDPRSDSFAGGTWNQIGLGFDYPLIDDEYWQLQTGGRVAYVYAKYSKLTQEEYIDRLESGEDVPVAPENKGLNFSTQIEASLKLGTDYLLLGVTGEVGYHLLLPRVSMGVNFQALGFLRLNIDFFSDDDRKTSAFE